MLELKKLRVSLQDSLLFPVVDLMVETGDLLGVMGPSGCGKSSLLGAIAGNLSAVFAIDGDIMIDGESVRGLPAWQRRIGLLYQDDLLFPHMNVEQNLAFALSSQTRGRKRSTLIDEALKQAGLANFQKRDIETLSGGQRARISLLRTLLAQPRVVLLDEPFSKLDQELREQFRDWVFDALSASQATAVLVSHDIQDFGGHRIYELQKGEMR